MPTDRFPQRHGDEARWRRGAPPQRRRPVAAAETAWEDQAEWYDDLQGEAGDDFHREVVLPAVLRQLDARAGQLVLDLGCGQGVLGRILAAGGIRVVGVDASPSLVDMAQSRAGEDEEYLLADARSCAATLVGRTFDHVALVLALQDLDPLGGVLRGAAQLVRPGGRLVAVLTHPCFRGPKISSTVWDAQRWTYFRRIDGYLGHQQVPIRTHPGRVADSASTTSFHRPLGDYLNALGTAGWGVVGCEELCSHRRGSQGKRSEAEDQHLKEIPVFLVLTAVRLSM